MHIVIEGTDGSGKATQTKMLVDRFETEGFRVKSFSFPRYGQSACYAVEKYLHGEYGSADEVGPYAGSMFYAMDRYDAANDIKECLSNNINVICDRYTSANMGHQAGKIDDIDERDKYLDWLNNLEFELLKIPKPDRVIFLYVDPIINQKLISNRKDKEYLKGKKRDIHEADMNHLIKSSQAFLYVAKKYDWIIINCAPDGELLGVEKIHKLIWDNIAYLR